MREQKTLLHRTSRKSFACIEDELVRLYINSYVILSIRITGIHNF
jgi:hypothetical protein